MSKIYLIGDIHGRDFWKELKDNTEDLIVFVGDYVDPYTYYEPITKEDALQNFKEIIDFAKSRNNVVLLTGNHDMTYFLSTDICECRTDYDNYVEIQKLFIDNKDLFNLAHYIEYNNEKIVVSHAGIHIEWLNEILIDQKDPKSVVSILNQRFHNLVNKEYDRKDPFGRALACVSYHRGGWGNFGSCVWADVHEWEDIELLGKGEKLDCYQIFGHTQLMKGYPMIGKTIACIDAKTVYTLDEILEIRNKNIKKNENN